MSLTLGIIASSRGNIVPPLDTYGGAAAAYSTRLLSSAYGGSAVRVRRSFDNAEQDIGFSGGAIDETALMNFVGYQNLFLQSQTFTDASWTKFTSTVIANAGTDPFGGNNSTKLIPDVSATGGQVRPTAVVNIVQGQSYTWSAYVKAAEFQYVSIVPWSNDDPSVVFNLSNGTIVSSSGPTTTSSIQSVGNGWYRVSVTRVAPSTGAWIRIVPFSTSFSQIGDGSSGILIYGAQINAGTTAQTYQVTTSAARSGDGFVTKWYTQDSNGENLLQQSQTFENGYWVKVNSSVSINATTAPDGTLTAEKLIDNTVNDAHYVVSNTVSITGSLTYTYSFYVKAAEITAGGAALYSDVPPYDSNLGISFNLTTGTVTPNPFGAAVVLSTGISNVGSGWYRIWCTGLTNRTNIHRFNISLGAYLGTGTQGFFIWGAQLSQSSWLQPYQVTTTTAILRRDASQSTAANQPRIVGGGVIERENGKAAIRFDGTDDFLSLASDITYTTTGNQYISAVFTPAVAITVANIYVPLATIGTADSRMIYALGSVTSSLVNERLSYLTVIGGNVLGYGQTVSDLSPTPKLQSISFDPPSLFNIFQNSIQQQFSTSTSGAFSSSQYPSTFGRIGASPSPSSFFLGDMQEIILYGTSRSANRGDIDRNVGAYYQTQWTGASSGLLDQFGGAAAAYSLRNLSSSYRGPLIRVRRSSDNAETDIGGTYNGDLDVASLVSFTGGQNLLTNSEDFTQIAWIKTNSSITANATIAPDGALTADKYTETAVNGQHAVGQNYTISASSSFTLSFYAKAAERSNIGISFYLNSATFDNIVFNLNLITGVVNTSNAGGAGLVISTSVQNVGNGWWRCSLTGTTNKTGGHVAQISLLDGSFNASYLGVAGSGVYVWGAQLNTGILQPYIPTTTAAVNGANAFVTKWYTQDNNYQNLVTFSEQFENAAWGKSNVVATPNTTTAPDGTLTADTIGISAGGYIRQLGKTVATSVVYTYSCYVKNNTTPAGTIFSLYLNNNVGGAGASYVSLLINIAAGTASVDVPSAGTTVLASGFTSVGDGWYRAFFTFSTTVATATNAEIGLTSSSNCSFFAWGAQINEGTLVPYTATTTTVSQRRDAIQATAANQPRIVNAGGVESEGNRPAIAFIDNTDILSVSSSGTSINNTMLTVQRGTTSGAYKVIFSAGPTNTGNSYSHLKSNVDQRMIYMPNSSTWSVDGTFAEQLEIWSSTSATNLRKFWVNNATQSITNSTLNITSDLSLITIGNDATGSSWQGGDIQEALFWQQTQSDTSVSMLNSNINSYYRIYWQGNGTALLDSFSGASAAYSLRNLSSAYTGPLIRVRRSSDNVERDIYGTFGGDLDIASLVAFVGANSGFVTTWYDQSGNARHATQGTAANQPRIVNAGVVDTLNGKPSLFFDGAGDALANAGVTSANWTILSVVNIAAGSVYGGIYVGVDIGLMYHRNSGGYGYRGVSTYNPLFATIAGTQSLFLDVNGTLGSMYVNQVAGSINQPLAGVSSTTLTRVFGDWAGATFGGNTQELIIYNSSLPSIRNGTQSNINNYYKIY